MENEEREEEGLEHWFEQFQRVFPFDATMRIAEARAAGAVLSIKDRAKALRAAAAYATDLKHRGGTRPIDAAKWLRQRRFDDVETIKGGQAQAQGLARPLVFAAKGSRAWAAWLAHKGVRSLPDSATAPDKSGKPGWYFPSLWPPGVDPPPDDERA